MLTLPDGKRVRCWRRDAAKIREDVARTGNVMLRRPEGSEVYDRVDPLSDEALEVVQQARHVT